MVTTILWIVMALSGVCVVAGLVASLFDSVDNESDFASDLKFALISGIICVLSIIATYAIQSHFDNMKYTYSNKPVSVEHISALQDNSEVNGTIYGSRYCVRGYFDEKLYYSYMVNLSDGGKTSNKVPADETTIYETDSNFRVEWYVKTKKWLGMKDGIKYWKIYLPKGSITDDYNVDLK